MALETSLNGTSLRFQWKDIVFRGRGLTFDDVLILPNRSDVKSRRDPNLKTRLTKKIDIDIPLISANMDTITEAPMAVAIAKEGGFGPIHRFMTIEDQVRNIREVVNSGAHAIGASVGVGDDMRLRAEALVEAGTNVIVVDIAHGHSVQMLETIKWLKDRFATIQVIGGNVAMPEAAIELAEAGADAVKVGIGPGSMCTTRVITGCGVPQMTAIAMCVEALDSLGVPVIGDGGLRTSGDIVKALASGASSVMLGSMLSGCLETPGELKGGMKQYRGMASKAAQVSWRGGVPTGMAAEGESRFVNVKGHVRDVVLEITGGIRSGMSYINATSINEIREKARFIEMTAAGTRESAAHGLLS